jgi:hypothetical protein
MMNSAAMPREYLDAASTANRRGDFMRRSKTGRIRYTKKKFYGSEKRSLSYVPSGGIYGTGSRKFLIQNANSHSTPEIGNWN